jgi:hypothetical protein
LTSNLLVQGKNPNNQQKSKPVIYEKQTTDAQKQTEVKPSVIGSRPAAPSFDKRLLRDSATGSPLSASPLLTNGENSAPRLRGRTGGPSGNGPYILTGARARLHERKLKDSARPQKAGPPQARKKAAAPANASDAAPPANPAALLAVSRDRQADHHSRLVAVRELGKAANNEEVREQLVALAHSQSEAPELRRQALQSYLQCARILPPEGCRR